MIVDPWGLVLCTVADGEGVGFAELDFDQLEQVRERLPALRHRRLS
jgi:predicted amidohydrolase